MLYLCVFLQRNEFQNFGIEELKGLLSLNGVDIFKAFAYEYKANGI